MTPDNGRTPYSDLPDRAFWRRVVRRGVAAQLRRERLIGSGDRVMSAGSCFAANMVPFLERAGIEYVRTEMLHPAFSDYPEHLGYNAYSAAYGNVYTARQFRQLLERALGRFQPIDAHEVVGGAVVDLLRPGLRFPALSLGEFKALTAQHLVAVSEAVQRATVVVFTLGLTEAWESKSDGTVFPVVPGSVGGVFDPSRFRFINFRYDSVVSDLRLVRELLREVNASCRLVLTVSPVPLVATASGEHVLEATVYSKSVLRAAAGDLASDYQDVDYFPAYEIVTGPQSSGEFFADDARSVTEAAVAAVMAELLGPESRDPTEARNLSSGPRIDAAARLDLSRRIVEVECEEAMLDIGEALPD